MVNRQSSRLRELDFLRGIAVIFVLCRHQHLFWITTNMGWIGVDLFFVLSGFLIAGLLFREYINFGSIDVKRFLIRRGFKIYPLYYFFLALYFCFRIFDGSDVADMRIIPELFFAQNYVVGSVYVMPISWSLAVEEHFYFCMAAALWVGIKRGWIRRFPHNTTAPQGRRLVRLIPVIMIACLLLRTGSNLLFPGNTGGNTRMTHLRIDSLLAGVLIAYWYYFKRPEITTLFRRFRTIFLMVAVAGMAWTPFVDMYSSFFAKTIGFTLLYVSCGIILLSFLLSENTNRRLNSLLTPSLVNAVSRIGYCSYAIYLVHLLIIMILRFFLASTGQSMPLLVQFLLVFGASILTGFLVTNTIERFCLSVRDRYFPARNIELAKGRAKTKTAVKVRELIG
ncbi:MAG: acyltransferase [Chitinophagaceae bacterium]